MTNLGKLLIGIATIEIVLGLTVAFAVAVITLAVDDPHPIGSLIVWSIAGFFLACPVLAILCFSSEKRGLNIIGLIILTITPLATLIYSV